MKLKPRKISILNFSENLVNRFRIIWHLLFWGAGFFILYKLFSDSDLILKIDFIYTAVFILPISLAVYLNLYLLMPLILKKERYLAYLAGFTLLTALCAAFIFKLFDKWIDYIFKDYYIISTLELADLLIYSAIFMILATLLKLSKEWFILMKFEKEMSMNQLRQLQSQINPHFLLNSLQTIYSLALNRSDKTPEFILKLSEILKFTLYESENELVNLEREIQVAREYIDMYRLRLDPIRVKINFELSGNPEGHKIIPLLFLPFIENSFKHGIQGSEKEAFVNIDFRINEKKLTFIIENNSGETGNTENRDKGGIGINNTRQRLDLLYPGKYRLKVHDNGNTYKVMLNLELS